jgi:Zn finger protein HypA/HybF involved in hydrogenase expression
MHDLHLADKILKTTLEVAKKNNLKEVVVVEINLGEVVEHGERVLPENLTFNFQLLAKDTSAEKAKLKVNSVEGDSWELVSIEGD